MGVVRQASRRPRADEPTVAIVSALFVEKLAVDAMIENKQILHRYKSDGMSGDEMSILKILNDGGYDEWMVIII